MICRLCKLNISSEDERTIHWEGHRSYNVHESCSIIEKNRGGKKDSLVNRKLDWSLLLTDLRLPLKLVAEVLHFAAYDKPKPYGPRNWLGGGEEFIYELKNAIERHNTAILEGEYLDPESGKPHRSHIICSQLFLLHFEEINRD